MQPAFRTPSLACSLWLLLALLLPARALCAPPSYARIYVVIDPYLNSVPPNASVSDLEALQAASTTSCGGATATSPFCGASSGVFFTVPWCNWETDSISGGSCGTVATQSGNSAGISEATSPCAATSTYDDCLASSISLPTSACAPGFNSTVYSTLGLAMHYVCLINLKRQIAGLPPLLLSVGLVAGVYTPPSALASGYIDAPFTLSQLSPIANIQAGATVCGRFPLVWPGAYTTAYDTALDALLNFLVSIDPQYAGATKNTISPIEILKIEGMNEETSEIVVDGNAYYAGSPFTAGTGPDCTYLTGTAAVTPAQNWLNVWGASSSHTIPLTLLFANAFGTIAGHGYARMTLLHASNPLQVPADFVLSAPTRNSQAFPQINCGVNGTGDGNPGLCQAQTNTTDQYSIWYFLQYMNQLLPNANGNFAGAGKAAQTAASALGVTYDPTALQFAVDSTNLAPVPPNTPDCNQTDCPSIAITELPYNLNYDGNVSADEETFNLDNIPNSFTGSGFVLSFQTVPGDVNNCDKNSDYLKNVLDFGINNGAQFLEVSQGESSQSGCQPDLAAGAQELLGNAPSGGINALPPPGACEYTPPSN